MQHTAGQHDHLAGFPFAHAGNRRDDGTLPRGVGIARLRDAPAEWSKQHAMLGLAS
jgi:hypothetical protein